MTGRSRLGRTVSYRVMELLVQEPGISVYDTASRLEDEGFGDVSLGTISAVRSWLRKALVALSANAEDCGVTLDPAWVDRVLANSKRTRMNKREREYWGSHGREVVEEAEEPSVVGNNWLNEGDD